MASEHDDSSDHGDEHDDEEIGGHGGGHGDHHEEGGHGEPWLVSYADLMTLLFGFFVLMYSFEAAKNSDEASMVRMRKELAQYFGGGYVNPLNVVASQYKAEVASQNLAREIAINETPEGLEITFQSTTLFDSGSALLSETAQKVISPLIRMLIGQKREFDVRVEGYTDDVPIKSEKFPSNWELSGNRAATVLRLFESAGFNSDRLMAMGYGSTRPAHPNRDSQGVPIPLNQARNRRVKIFVLNNLEEEKKKGELQAQESSPKAEEAAGEATSEAKVEVPVETAPVTTLAAPLDEKLPDNLNKESESNDKTKLDAEKSKNRIKSLAE